MVQEPTVFGYLNTQRLGTNTTKKKEKAGEGEMKCILADENNSLENPSLVYYRVDRDEYEYT